jgi:hypothetical protein
VSLLIKDSGEKTALRHNADGQIADHQNVDFQIVTIKMYTLLVNVP